MCKFNQTCASLNGFTTLIPPVEINSRINDIARTANVYPRPIPKPSKAESKTPFLLAKASARPKMIQLTTINGMNTPKLVFKLGA